MTGLQDKGKMRAAQSYTLDSTFARTEKHRQRMLRPPRRRKPIRSSISAGPTIASSVAPLQRTYGGLNRPHNTTENETSWLCSVSGDVSSTSSSTSADSTEERGGGEDINRATLQRVMHMKHCVIRHVREQMIKLNQNGPACQTEVSNESSFAPPESQSQNQIAKSTNQSNCDFKTKSLQNGNETQEHDDTSSSLLQKHADSLKTASKNSNNGDKNGEIIATDNSDPTRNMLNSLECDRYSVPVFQPSRSSVVNRKITRKMNKFFIPFTNKSDPAGAVSTLFLNAEKYVGNKNCLNREGKSVGKNCADSFSKLDQLKKRELGSQQKSYHQNERPDVRIWTGGANPLPQTHPSVKMFYENPILKHPSGSWVLHKDAPCPLAHVGPTTTSKSTNTIPMGSRPLATGTPVSADERSLEKSRVSFRNGIAEPEQATTATTYPRRSFDGIQPLLFVLTVFTVSMSGAYVGVFVAGATCAGYFGGPVSVECEPSLLHWLFPSQTSLRAF